VTSSDHLVQTHCQQRIITVLVLTPTRLYREGLSALLGARDGIDVIGTAPAVDEALVALSTLRADVVLLDIDMPNALSAARKMVAVAPAIKVIALALEDQTDRVLDCAEAGMAGFVNQDASVDDLLSAITAATTDELTCTPKIAAALLHRVADLARTAPGQEHDVLSLTNRETDIIKLIDKGLSNKEIAARLCIGVATVKNHVHNILEKLHVHRRGEAAARVRTLLQT
jgi:two-component system nitrate/nitrite response regulator NarL